MARPPKFDRTKVVKQAMDVFWEKGYEATSINDLTAATTLKPGSLYNTFQSKHQIYLEALDYYSANVGSCLFDILSEPISGVEAIRSLFENLIAEELNDPKQRGCMMQNAILERAAQDNDVAMRAGDSHEQGKLAFKNALIRAHQAGELSDQLDIDQTASYLVSIVYAIRTAARTTTSRTELRGIVDMALTTLR